MLIALLFLHLVVGAAVAVAGRRLRRRSFLVAAVAPAATLAWLATEIGPVLDGRPVQAVRRWVPALGADVAVRLDAFSALVVLAISGVGLTVLAFSWWYFAPSRDDLGRLAGLLTWFAGSMLAVVVADDVFVLYTAWELTSITSYLLIGNDHAKAAARASALHALLVTSAGGLVLLAGLVLVAQAAGTFRISAILADPPGGAAVTAGLVCIAVGAFTKSAQYPFHSWLPGAMVAPTPISAYLHSATMVKAGIYVIARFAPVFATVGPWRPVVVGVGLATMACGGARALRQHDLKLLLAYGTVSQLGFLVVLFGTGLAAATAAGAAVLVAHVLFKAALFMVVGVVDVQTGGRDRRLLPPLGAGWLPIKVVAVVSAASMAGVPAMAGFVGKESAYGAFVDGELWGGWAVLATLVAASTLTCAYSVRFVVPLLRSPRRKVDAMPAPAPPRWFVAPAAVLAALTVVVGVVPGTADRAVAGATRALDRAADPGRLALWHGFNLPLALSALTLALGAATAVAHRGVDRVLALGAAVPRGTEVYLAVLQLLNRAANRVTSVVQSGRLSVYAGVILATAAVLPGAALVRRAEWPGWPEVVGQGAHIPITVALIGGALMSAVVRRRFTAVLFLSTVGYGMAALFVVEGAPDLALTQAAVETLSTVLFVLVLRKLPDRFERRSSPFTRTVRVTVAAMVAAMVFTFAIVAGGSRSAEPVSTEMVERALPDAQGRNVVNVILVDFRALDTMGEISVLAAAAIGCVALARAGRRPAGKPTGKPS